jgi:hypothetical protein
MKENGNKIKLKQENNKAPVFFITFKKKGKNKSILKRLCIKKEAEEKTITNLRNLNFCVLWYKTL